MQFQGATALGGLLLTFLVVNYLWHYFVGFPAPYCFARWLVKPLFATWWHYLTVLLFFVWLYFMFAGKSAREVIGVIVLIGVVVALPGFADHVGGLGKSCG